MPDHPEVTSEGGLVDPVDHAALIESAYNYERLIKVLRLSLVTISVAFVILLIPNLILKFSSNKTLLDVATSVTPMIAVMFWFAKFFFGISWLVMIWDNAKFLNVEQPLICKNLKSIFWLRLMTTFAARLPTLSFVSIWIWFAFDLLWLWLRDWVIARKFPSRVALWQFALGVLIGLLSVLGYN
jgi:hypothetical protein